MMEITIKLFAVLRKGRFDEQVREYPGGTTVEKIIDELQIPADQAALIFVNSKHAKASHRLSHGDTVALFPLVGGG
jgi:molybdopterin converting factor small subunit